jgi:hypothetical protein
MAHLNYTVDGRRFADEFYKDIYQQSLQMLNEISGERMIHLALALKIREKAETRALYHWAAFVLHDT